MVSEPTGLRPASIRGWRTAVLALALLAACPPPAGADAARADTTKVTVVQTTADLSQRLTRLPDLRLRSRAPRAASVIAVDDGRRYQRVSGFGAAMTDSAAWLLYAKLSPAARAAAMGRLFGPRGIRLGFVRVPIGASDFTRDGTPYTYADVPPGQSDPGLADVLGGARRRVRRARPAADARDQPAREDPREPVEPTRMDEEQRLAGQPRQRRRAAAQRVPAVRGLLREVPARVRAPRRARRRGHAPERAGTADGLPRAELARARPGALDRLRSRSGAARRRPAHPHLRPRRDVVRPRGRAHAGVPPAGRPRDLGRRVALLRRQSALDDEASRARPAPRPDRDRVLLGDRAGPRRAAADRIAAQLVERRAAVEPRPRPQAAVPSRRPTAAAGAAPGSSPSTSLPARSATAATTTSSGRRARSSTAARAGSPPTRSRPTTPPSTTMARATRPRRSTTSRSRTRTAARCCSCSTTRRGRGASRCAGTAARSSTA